MHLHFYKNENKILFALRQSLATVGESNYNWTPGLGLFFYELHKAASHTLTKSFQNY